MARARTIRRLAYVGCWLALGSGCELGSKRPPREQLPRPALSSLPALESRDAGSRPMPSALASALRDVREHRLEISVPPVPDARLAFGKQRLAQAADPQVRFRDSKTGEVLASVDLGGVRAVGAGEDGSLFALGLSGGARLEARATRPRNFAHVTFFPGSALFPDLEEPSHFYVYDASERLLYQYAFQAEAGTVLPIESQFPREGCVGAIALLRDGAFVCATAEGIERGAPRGRRSQFKLPAGTPPPLRLLPAQRLDELFSVGRAGEVLHLRLAAGTPVLGRFQLPALPFAAAGNGEALAFVLVSAAEPGKSRHWSLLVTDLEGQARLQAELEAKVPPLGEDWQEAVVSGKNLAISEFEPLVAVGGPDGVGVWNYTSVVKVFSD